MLNSRNSGRGKILTKLEKKRVLHISTSQSWRGGEQQLAYLVEKLDSEVEQTVLCAKGSAMEAYCQKNGINHYAQKKLKGGIDFFFSSTIKKLCKKLVFDLCHLHDAHAHTAAILSVVLFGNKTPLVLSRRVDFPIKNNFLSLYKYNHPSIKKILCVSELIKNITAKSIKDQGKLHTVYSGVDLNKFKARTFLLRNELGLTDENRLIGNTSALADHKDYFTFIDVAEKLLKKDDSLSFVVIGDGPMKNDLVSYLRKKKLEEKIHFIGYRTNLPDLLADFDVFLITSKTEGLGTSILDAFACGVPVVGTAAGGIPELIEDRKTGLLCPVKAVDCLVDSVNQLLEDSQLAKHLSEQAKEKVKQFSKAETAIKTLEHYREVWS